MVDSKIEPEDLAHMKPIGMECVHNKKMICGNFKNLKQFYDYGGERFCKRACPDKPSYKRKREAEEALAHIKKYPKGASIRKHFQQKAKRPYQMPLRGRVVDAPHRLRRRKPWK